MKIVKEGCKNPAAVHPTVCCPSTRLASSAPSGKKDEQAQDQI